MRPGQAARAGLLIGWTTAAAAAMDPRPSQRLVGTLWIALTTASGILGLLYCGAAGAVVGAVAGASLYFLIIMVLMLGVMYVLMIRPQRQRQAQQQSMIDGASVGEVTSGMPAPTVGKNLALALVRADLAKIGTELHVIVRGKPIPAIVPP